MKDSLKGRIMHRVREIPYQKGSKGWLLKFITIMWQKGYCALEVYNLTPDMLFQLKFLAKSSAPKGTKKEWRACPGFELYDWFQKNGFRTGMSKNNKYYLVEL